MISVHFSVIVGRDRKLWNEQGMKIKELFKLKAMEEARKEVRGLKCGKLESWKVTLLQRLLSIQFGFPMSKEIYRSPSYWPPWYYSIK